MKLIFALVVAPISSLAVAQTGPSIDDAKLAYELCVASGYRTTTAVRVDGMIQAYGDIQHSTQLKLAQTLGRKIEIYCEDLVYGVPVIPLDRRNPGELNPSPDLTVPIYSGDPIDPSMGMPMDPRFPSNDGSSEVPIYPYPLPTQPPIGDPYPPGMDGGFGGGFGSPQIPGF